jgi:hypothetical protein
MRSKRDLALQLLEGAYQTMLDNVENVSLAEALFVPQGGYRSIIGTLKHTAGWCHVYRSYAFDPSPKHWKEIDWPHGLRDTIIPSDEYLADVIAWYKEAHRRWAEDLRKVEEADLDEPRPLHWGASEPLFDIVARIALHDAYHAG